MRDLANALIFLLVFMITGLAVYSCSNPANGHDTYNKPAWETKWK